MASLPRSRLAAMKALEKEWSDLKNEPAEGFRTKLPDENNLFKWEVAIFGAPGTLYEYGYFKAQIDFTENYPYDPPKFRFISKIWHPNVFENGELCISILHPPTEDPTSGESIKERWTPTQNVRTILLSIISLLHEPNADSPANVDASISYRHWKDGKNDKFKEIVQRQVKSSQEEAKNEGIEIPMSHEEYVEMSKPKKMFPPLDDDYGDYGYDDLDDEEDEDEDEIIST